MWWLKQKCVSHSSGSLKSEIKILERLIPLGGLGGESFLESSCFGWPQEFLAQGYTLCPCFHRALLVCFTSSSASLIRTSGIRFRTHLKFRMIWSWDHNFLYVTIIPNKVLFTSAGGESPHISFGRWPLYAHQGPFQGLRLRRESQFTESFGQTMVFVIAKLGQEWREVVRDFEGCLTIFHCFLVTKSWGRVF